MSDTEQVEVDEVTDYEPEDDEPEATEAPISDKLAALKNKIAKARTKPVKEGAQKRAKRGSSVGRTGKAKAPKAPKATKAPEAPRAKAPTAKQFKAKVAAKVRQSKANGGSGPAVAVSKAIIGVGLPGKCQDGCGNSPKAGSYFMPGHFPKLLAWLRKTAAGHRPDNATVPYYHRVTTPSQARAMLGQFHISKAGQGQKARRAKGLKPIAKATVAQPKAVKRTRRTKAEMAAARAQQEGIPANQIDNSLLPPPEAGHYGSEFPPKIALLEQRKIDQRIGRIASIGRIATVLEQLDLTPGSPAYFYLRGVLGI